MGVKKRGGAWGPECRPAQRACAQGVQGHSCSGAGEEEGTVHVTGGECDQGGCAGGGEQLKSGASRGVGVRA